LWRLHDGQVETDEFEQEMVEQTGKLGERLFIDISLTEHESYGKAKFWLLVVGDVTNLCWSYFLKSKSKTTQVMIDLSKELSDKNKIKVKKICCNNSGENCSFQQAAKQEHGLGITIEFTARKTPLQNGRVEKNFAMLFDWVCTMLNGTGLIEQHEPLWQGLWAECTATATKIENIVMSQNKKVPAYKLFYDVDAPYAKCLRTFGEVRIVHDAQRIRVKLQNWAKGCLFVGCQWPWWRHLLDD